MRKFGGELWDFCILSGIRLKFTEKNVKLGVLRGLRHASIPLSRPLGNMDYQPETIIN